MSRGLEALHVELSALLSRLDKKSRSGLSREIAKTLRDSQRARIASQQNPDGSSYEPRKKQKDKKSRPRTLFAKLRTPAHLKTTTTADRALIHFAGGDNRIAAVHQFGLQDSPSKTTGHSISYPERQLLGFTDADIKTVEDLVFSHLAK